jgi:asparagine synthetase B (glutamine-hydrolysing)
VLAYLKSWLTSAAAGQDMLNDLLAMEQLTWLPEDALIRNDKIGMSFGMEGRYPFVSRTFREMAMALPSSIKIVNGRLKRTARWAYQKVLPEFIVGRRRKSGWAAPVLEWQSVGGQMGGLLDDSLASSGLLSGYLDLDGISASKEPKLIYSAVNLLAWSRRVGALPPING